MSTDAERGSDDAARSSDGGWSQVVEKWGRTAGALAAIAALVAVIVGYAGGALDWVVNRADSSESLSAEGIVVGSDETTNLLSVVVRNDTDETRVLDQVLVTEVGTDLLESCDDPDRFEVTLDDEVRIRGTPGGQELDLEYQMSTSDTVNYRASGLHFGEACVGSATSIAIPTPAEVPANSVLHLDTQLPKEFNVTADADADDPASTVAFGSFAEEGDSSTRTAVFVSVSSTDGVCLITGGDLHDGQVDTATYDLERLVDRVGCEPPESISALSDYRQEVQEAALDSSR